MEKIKFKSPTEAQREESNKAFTDVTQKLINYMIKDIGIYAQMNYNDMNDDEVKAWVKKEMQRIEDVIVIKLQN